MTVALFGAILVGRPALSMRNLVVAAFIIIAMEPESVLGPSFQMSVARSEEHTSELQSH